MTLSMVLSLVPMTALAAGDGQEQENTVAAESQSAGEDANGSSNSNADSGSPPPAARVAVARPTPIQILTIKTKARIADPKTPAKRHPVALLNLKAALLLVAAPLNRQNRQPRKTLQRSARLSI